MGVAYAPFEIDEKPPQTFQKVSLKAPVSDNTECNYIVLGFVASVFLLGIVDFMRAK
jgi:hypothetical protein